MFGDRKSSLCLAMMFNSPFLSSHWSTGFTCPRSIFSDNCIFFSKFVTVFAKHFCPPLSVSDGTCMNDGLHRIATFYIFTMRYYFKVARIHAMFYSAKMIDLQFNRYWSLYKFIGDAMCGVNDWLSFFFTDKKSSVAAFPAARSPQPTWTEFWVCNWKRAVLIYLRPKAISKLIVFHLGHFSLQAWGLQL